MNTSNDNWTLGFPLFECYMWNYLLPTLWPKYKWKKKKKKPTNRARDMLKAVCRQSERSCEEFVKVAMLECSEWIRSSFILAHEVRRQKHRTDRTYKTKWTDCGVRIWTTYQKKKAPCAKTDRRKRNHIACSLINIIDMNTLMLLTEQRRTVIFKQITASKSACS